MNQIHRRATWGLEAPEAILDWSVWYLKYEDEPRLAVLLEDCKLNLWQERDEQLALVASEWADYYP